MGKPIEPDEDARIARALGCSPEEVATEKGKWDNNHILRAVFDDRFTRRIEENRTQLETCTAADLQGIQGETKALRTARGLVLKPNT